jgi:hypothetical protein
VELPAGYTLGAFQIIDRIGKGATGTVYRARQPALERDVALKVLNASTEPEALARLHSEAIRVAQLRHPNILPVFDFGQQDDIAYIAMQLADGGTLAQRMSQPIGVSEAIQILKPVAQAIDYAHELNVVHRDVKPANMLFDGGRVFLSDFGLALMRDATSSSGQMAGTPWYMAPEQFRGKAEAASDIYALAVTLYQMLTGHLPFERDTALAVMLAHLKDPVPPAREWNANIPEPVDRVLRRGMAKEPRLRFQRAIQLLAAVHAAQRDTPAGAVSAGPSPPPRSWPAMAAPAAAHPLGRGRLPAPSAPTAKPMATTAVVPTAAPTPAQAPPRGRCIFESQLTLQWAKANIVLGDPKTDRIRLVGDLIEVALSQRSQAQLLLPVGVLNDFMAELQFAVKPNSGLFDLLFHEGASALSHCARLDPQRGQISLGTVKASGGGGERWLASRGVGMDPRLQHKLLVVANQSSIEAYLDGKGVVAARDKTLGWGMLRLQMLPAPLKPTSTLLLQHISVYRLPEQS